VEFHALVDYTVIPGTVAFLKRKLADNGYEKEIWAGDATSGPGVGTMAAMMDQESYEGDNGNINLILKNPEHADYPKVRKWFRREQASLAIKKYVISLSVGLTKVFMCCLEDWVGSPWPYHGLTDDDGTPRPVYHAIQFLTNRVDGFESFAAVEGEKGIYAFQLGFPERQFYVIWYETNENELDLVTAENPTTTMLLPVNAAQVRVIGLDAVCDNPHAQGEIRATANGAISLDLDRYPMFVEVPK
jgi:hypothetical protein